MVNYEREESVTHKIELNGKEMDDIEFNGKVVELRIDNSYTIRISRRKEL